MNKLTARLGLASMNQGDFYHWHGAIFAYSGLPPYIRNARIDSVKVFIQVSINSAAYKLKIVKLPNNDTTLSDSWSHLVYPLKEYLTDVPYSTASSGVELKCSELANDIGQNPGEQIVLGVVSMNETDLGTYIEVRNLEIRVHYSPVIVVTIKNSFDGGMLEVDGVERVSPWVSSIDSGQTWYAGDDHSIRAYSQATGRTRHPFRSLIWSSTCGQGRTQSSEEEAVTIAPSTNCTMTAVFDPAEIDVTIDQRFSTGMSTGSLGIGIAKWEGGPDFINYSVPRDFTFIVPSVQALRATQNIEWNEDIQSFEKYNKWMTQEGAISDVTNHHSFGVDEYFTPLLLSQLQPTTQSSTIKVNFLDAPGSYTGTISFKDPWLIDYPDPAYNNKPRNRGMDASFKSRTAPFTPDYATSFGGDVHKGIFLNENPLFTPDKPVYSVSAPSTQTLSVGGQSYASNFATWAAVNATVAQPTSLTTPVVFNSLPATVTAYYKGHLVSGTASATSTGHQRKMARDYSGTLHSVYVSGGIIWYVSSTDGGATWSTEQRLSGNGAAETPSVSTGGVFEGEDVYFVWQETVGNEKRLMFRSLDFFPTPIVLDSDNSAVNLQPAIAVGVLPYFDEILIVYKKMYNGRHQVHYKVSFDGGQSFPVGEPLHLQTPIIWDYPSVAWNSYEQRFVVSTLFSMSSTFHVQLLGFDGADWYCEDLVYSATQIPPGVPYSQIAVDGYGRNHITWIGYDSFYGNQSAAFHRSRYYSTWSPISIFRDDIMYEPPITYTSVSGHTDANGGVSLFYTANTDQTLFNVYATDGVNWNGWIYIGPSAPIKYPVAVEKAPPQSVSFVTTKGTAVPYSVIHQTKNNSQGGYGSGSLKTLATDEAQLGAVITKVHRRIELVDTASGGSLTVQFGNFSKKGIEFSRSENLSTSRVEPSFLATEPTVIGLNDTVAVDFGVKSINWHTDAVIELELVDADNGTAARKLGQLSVAGENTQQERTALFVNRLGELKGRLQVRLQGINEKNIIAYHANVYTLSGGKGAEKQGGDSRSASIEVPTEYSLNQNYPNPFNPSTTIRFDLPYRSGVQITIYNVLGQKVDELLATTLDEGSHQIPWTATGSAGVYICRMEAVAADNPSKRFSAVRKMLLVK